MSEVLSLIESGPSKILGLKVGSRQVQPGEYFPRAGESSRSRDLQKIAEEEEERKEIREKTNRRRRPESF